MWKSFLSHPYHRVYTVYMISRWANLKPRAIILRRRGASIRDIEMRLGVSRSTLSGWLKQVPLSPKHLRRLQKRHKQSLMQARAQAVIWHNAEKQKRLVFAQQEAMAVLHAVDNAQKTLEIALAMLYLGEGTKRHKGLVLGNANPDVLLFFISALQKLYKIDVHRLRCELHLRADQKSNTEKIYWSKALTLPQTCFKAVYVDKRTQGKKTYTSYHGVCIISYGDVAIQRKLMYLYQLYCREVIRGLRA